MWFFTSFYNSLANVPWLVAALEFPKRAWGYFIVLMVLFSIITAVPFVVVIPHGLASVRSEIDHSVPNFQGKFTSAGLVITGVPQPFMVRSNDNSVTFILDTVRTTTFSVDQLPKGDYVLVTKTGVATSFEGQTSERAFPLQNISTTTFEKATILGWFDKLSAPRSLIWMFPICVIGIFIALVVSRLLSILLAAVVVSILARFLERPWNFSRLFVVGLYATTLPSIIAIVAAAFGVYFSYLHTLALVAFLVAMIISTKRVPKVEEPGV